MFNSHVFTFATPRSLEGSTLLFRAVYQESIRNSPPHFTNTALFFFAFFFFFFFSFSPSLPLFLSFRKCSIGGLRSHPKIIYFMVLNRKCFFAGMAEESLLRMTISIPVLSSIVFTASTSHFGLIATFNTKTQSRARYRLVELILMIIGLVAPTITVSTRLRNVVSPQQCTSNLFPPLTPPPNS